MNRYLVTRHDGTVDWVGRQGLEVKRLPHLDNLSDVHPGDHVIGPLPVRMIAAITAAGAHYFSIDMDLPRHARGPELSADDMERYHARLVEYRAEAVPGNGQARK